MILGIDVSNLRGGGGVTHITGLLKAADPLSHGFSKVVLWGGSKILRQLPDHDWLEKSPQDLLNRSLPYRIFWQRYRLSELAQEAGCDLLFVPGGSYSGDFSPVTTMCRNMLPFERRELRRYGLSFTRLRLELLRLAQTKTFQKAAGVIFLSQYAHDSVIREIGPATGKSTIIPHGVDRQFCCSPRKQLPIECYSSDRPFNVIYVSIVRYVQASVGSGRSCGTAKEERHSSSSNVSRRGLPPCPRSLKENHCSNRSVRRLCPISRAYPLLRTGRSL